MVSQAKLTANRANARKSTGPRTPEGKRRASRNAVTHGLCAAEAFLPGEDLRLFTSLQLSAVQRFRPRDFVELALVEHLASALWRLKRHHAAEASLIERRHQTLLAAADARRQVRDPDAGPVDAKLIPPALALPDCFAPSPDGLPSLETLARYESRLQATVHRCLRELRQLRTDDPASPPQPGFTPDSELPHPLSDHDPEAVAEDEARAQRADRDDDDDDENEDDELEDHDELEDDDHDAPAPNEPTDEDEGDPDEPEDEQDDAPAPNEPTAPPKPHPASAERTQPTPRGIIKPAPPTV